MTEEEISSILATMEADPTLVTKSAYRANAELWPDHKISFSQTHLAYIKNHPALNPKHYLSNLRLKLKIR